MNEQSKGFRYWVGVDWGCEEHEVCALSAEGQQNETFEHGGKGISALVDWVVAACDGQVDALAVGIEKSHGAVVEALMEREIAVFAINPKQADRFRDRHSVAGAKDDELDAYVIADSLRTDMKLYRRVHKEMPQIVQLRERSRMYDELKNERIRLSNRLYAHLHRYYPAILRLSPAADEPWIWSLLEQAPTPQAGQRLRPVTIKRLLREHRIRRLTAAEVHEQLRQPALRLAPGTVEAASEHVLLLLPRIRLVDQQKNRCKRDIRSALDQLPQPKDAAGDPGAEGNPAHDDQDTKVEHRDVDIIRSLPGIGDLITATVLSEASQPLISRQYHNLIPLGGVVPVTIKSGKKGKRRPRIIMRYACKTRLRNAIHYWGSAAIRLDPQARAFYDSARSRGQGHAHALRVLAAKQLRCLVAMLRDRTLYNPDRRSGKSTFEGAA